MLSGIEVKDAKPIDAPVLKATSAESGLLADRLLKTTGRDRDEMLDTMETDKGVKYTEALALAIPKLEGETRKQARGPGQSPDAHEGRNAGEYFQDDDRRNSPRRYRRRPKGQQGAHTQSDRTVARSG